MMLWADPVIRSVHLDVPTGKKWVVTDTVGEAEGKLKHKIVEAIQQDRRGLGGRRGTWWSKKNERGRHDMVTEILGAWRKEGRFLLQWGSLRRVDGPLGRQFRTGRLSGQTYGQWNP